MSDWFWIRHGPTHEKNFTGWRDVPADLSDRALIDRLSAYLPPEAVVVSSDLTRSVTTADAIAGGRTRLPHEADLREFHFGDWDGRHWSDVAQTDPQLSRDFWEKPGDIMAPNAAHNSIIAVAHFGIILTQVQRALDSSAYACLAHKIDNFSVTHLREDQGEWQVICINHLP